MLVIARYLNERVYLDLPDGRRLALQVLEIGNRDGKPLVRLGFDAPKDISITRDNAVNREPRQRV